MIITDTAFRIFPALNTRQCDILKLVAFAAMVLDHLWLMELLAQPGFWLAFRYTGVEWWQVNILFIFAVMDQSQSPCNRTAFVSLLALSVYIPVSGSQL